MAADSSIVSEAHEQYDIPTKKITTVSSIAARINQELETTELQAAHVVGEVTNLREWRDHLFFSLKDEHAKLNVVMFNAGSITIDDGDTILARGAIDFYQDEGKTSLKANTIFPLGKGRYYQQLQKRKKRLRQVGYFDENQDPAKIPEQVAIIAGDDSDAVSDVRDTVWARAPWIDIEIIPVSVQGDNAIDELHRGIAMADRDVIDTIIIARGGGDIEAFKPFNTWKIAEVIDTADTPIITGIGHRDDETIAGLTANVRGFTPTDAAKKASKDIIEIRNSIEEREYMLSNAFESFTERKEQEKTIKHTRYQKRFYQAAFLITIVVLLVGVILL